MIGNHPVGKPGNLRGDVAEITRFSHRQCWHWRANHLAGAETWCERPQTTQN